MRNEYGAECYTKNGNGKWVFEPVESYPFYGRVSLANATEFTIGCFMVEKGRDAGRLFLAIEYKGCYTFDAGTFPSYVMEKLGVGEADAKPLADFINGQFSNPRELHFGEPQERYI